MGKIKVLFIDDDIALGNVVTVALNSLGYETYYQTSLVAIRSVIKELCPDILILDVEIGQKNGIEATSELRLILPDIPILFVSSHTESSFVTQALDAGGIAYLKKPFEIDELVAYIKRHTNTSSHASFLQIGQLTLYTQDYILMKGEQIVKRLTLSEGKLLTLLANHPDETISRQEMEQELWEDGYTNEQSLNNFIAKLRKYLSEDDTLELTTIPKVGYRLTTKHKPGI